MIRLLVDKIRYLLVGPNLMLLARMPKEDINQLIMLSTEDYLNKSLFAGAEASSKISTEQALRQEIQNLKKEISVLKEKVVTYERANITSKHRIDRLSIYDSNI